MAISEAERIVEALLIVAEANHYLVTVDWSKVTLNAFDAAEQILIHCENETRRGGAEAVGLALDICGMTRRLDLGRQSRGLGSLFVVERLGGLFLAAINKQYPGTILQGDGKGFVRPNGAGVYAPEATTGFYYPNLDGDRFYFDTAEEAAEDCAIEIGMNEAEARQIMAKQATRERE